MTQKDLKQIKQLLDETISGSNALLKTELKAEIKADSKLAFANQFEDIKQFVGAEIRRSEERLEEKMDCMIDEKLESKLNEKLTEFRDEIVEAFNQSTETNVEMFDGHELRIQKLESRVGNFAIA